MLEKIKNNRFLRPLLYTYPFARYRTERFLRSFDEISPEDASSVGLELGGSWQDGSIPSRQQAIVDAHLEAYKNGIPDKTFDTYVGIMARNIPGLDKLGILEIGCSSGYLSEVCRIKGIKSSYTGCDYSSEFIDRARSRYPLSQWDVEDALSLSYQDESFDVVVSGCCILHICDFELAIRETARVAKQFVIFHRTPVIQGDTKYYRKNAYGADMLEIHFSEPKLMALITRCGLVLKEAEVLDSFPYYGTKDTLEIKTYLFEKGN